VKGTIDSIVRNKVNHIYYEIKNSGYEKKLIAGIVVTGGGAKLKHVSQLIEYMTGMDTRIGYPNEHLAKGAEEIASPLFATSVGLVIKGFELSDSKRLRTEFLPKTDKKDPKPGGFFDALFAKTRNFFEDDNDKNS
jgi:cell division protein FtsA